MGVEVVYIFDVLMWMCADVWWWWRHIAAQSGVDTHQRLAEEPRIQEQAGFAMLCIPFPEMFIECRKLVWVEGCVVHEKGVFLSLSLSLSLFLSPWFFFSFSVCTSLSLSTSVALHTQYTFMGWEDNA